MSFCGILPGMIQRADFVFKQHRSEKSKTLLTKTYMADGEGEVYLNGGKFIVPMTERETRLFAAGREFYMDSKITLTDGGVPETEIAALRMNETLFEEVEENGR